MLTQMHALVAVTYMQYMCLRTHITFYTDFKTVFQETNAEMGRTKLKNEKQRETTMWIHSSLLTSLTHHTIFSTNTKVYLHDKKCPSAHEIPEWKCRISALIVLCF